MSEHSLMKFCPATGEPKPYPSQAKQWREYHGGTAWLFNPWTGERRHPADIGSDTFGLAIATNFTPAKVVTND
jgi:hypothetical protein